MKIYPAKIYFPQEDIKKFMQTAKEILLSGSFILGKYTEEFEERFARFVGTKYAVAVNSGTSALEISLRTLNVKGKEVIVPTNTNFATPAAVIHAGGNVRFIDADKTTFSITAEDIKKAITPNTVGVIIVHIGGIITPKIYQIQKLCKKHKLFLLEDAAHAHGSTLDGQKAGSFGDVAAFSFYPTKVITSIEGGMILTDSEFISNQAKMYRDQGKERDGRNYHVVLGNSWRISEIHAAAGILQLKRIGEFIKKRQKIARYYDKALNSIKGVSQLTLPANMKSNYYKYIALLDPGVKREEVKRKIKESGSRLSGEVYEIPCHLQPVFKNNFSGKGFPKAEDICNRHICLPIYPTMTLREAAFVVDSLHMAVKQT